ncbi:hypothetical protein ACIQOW_04285 [Kitasatospora sp. NPDC091335]|uniref:hypothetical protein n=1 Tax=Kitasatospora sp. NPDC091335 TaxID=3364085 RepID=UPI0037F59DEE
MVSFKELHEADFAAVNDAAEAWSGVAKALTSLDGRVAKDLTSTAQRAGWKGAAADEATRTLQGVDSDFKQASAVATALAAIMKTAAEDFAAARRDLDAALHDAQGDSSLSVTADGAVNWTVPKESRNDPEAERTIRANAQALSDRLGKAVAKATAADQRATVDLQADIGTSTTAFNPAPGGAGPVADAKRATDLMSKAGSLSDDQLKQLQALMAANAENKDFSTTLLNGLNAGGKTGPEALLEYSKVYDGLARGNHNAAGYQDVYKNLSVALATATRDGGMGKEWQDGLLAAARRPGGSAAGWNDNYPALTSLMGAGGTYDKPFLLKVSNDLVDYERNSKTKGEELWGPDYSFKVPEGDPLTPLVKLMKDDPATSQEFLDPSRNKNLTYLLKDRVWLDEDAENRLPAEVLRRTSHGMFGEMLQAAATMPDPNAPQNPALHDRASARIMDETLKALGGNDPKDASVTTVLRRPVAEMLAGYAPDMHEVLSKDLQNPSQPNGLTAKPEQLLRVVRGTLEDPENFQIIHQAESREIARRLDEFGADSFQPDKTGRPDHKLSAFTQESAKALGGLDAAFAKATVDHADEKKADIDWQQRMNYHYLGTPANAIPQLVLPGISNVVPLGDIAQRLVDVGTASYANQAKAEIDTSTATDVSSRYSAGRHQLDAMIAEKANQYGAGGQSADDTGSIPHHLMQGVESFYNTGIDTAYHSAYGKA